MAATPEGLQKARATKLGLTFQELQAREAAGEKFCLKCRTWQSRDVFGRDVTRWDGKAIWCPSCRAGHHKTTYVPHPAEGPPGPAPKAPRTGDKRQARMRVNVLVRTGRLARPNDLPCFDCGHEWTKGARRHEYDHFRGYESAHHYDVQAVCSKCHHRRARERGELKQVRSEDGKYRTKDAADG